MSKPIDFSKLPFFLAAAELMSFTEAASKLYITQSSLSKAIAALETSLGFPLFVRGNRKVSLTPEGEYLYWGLSKIMDEVDTVVDSALRIHNGSAGYFSLGASGILHQTPLFEKICSRFANECPGLEIDLRLIDYPDLRQNLMADKVDAILFNQHGLSGISGLSMIPLFQGASILLCSRELARITAGGHPGIEDFKNHKFVCLEPERFSDYYKYLMDCCDAYGFKPNITRYCHSIMEATHYVSTANYVTILDRSILPNVGTELEPIPIPQRDGMVRLDTVLAWKTDNTNRALQHFVRFAGEMHAKHI